MRSRGTALALVLAASACDCGRAQRPIWVGLRGDARVLAVSDEGSASPAAGPPAVAASVRALLVVGDGTILVLEDTAGGAPPAVLLDRSGSRIATFAAVDGSGTPLFGEGDPPWAAASASDGSIWVTGGRAPVLYSRDGTLAGLAAVLPSPTRGIAALPDGRMMVTHGLQGIAIYTADGALASSFEASLGSPETYYGIDALAVRGGTVLVSVLRHGASTEGVVVEATLGEASLVPLRDPGASARLPWAPSALVADGDDVLVGPALGSLAPPSCAVRLSSDLAVHEGCVTAGEHAGIAVVR